MKPYVLLNTSMYVYDLTCQTTRNRGYGCYFAFHISVSDFTKTGQNSYATCSQQKKNYYGVES